MSLTLFWIFAGVPNCARHFFVPGIWESTYLISSFWVLTQLEQNWESLKVYPGSYLIFFVSDKFKVKEIIIQIWITAIFVFSCFVAIKIAVSVEIACSCKGKC